MVFRIISCCILIIGHCFAYGQYKGIANRYGNNIYFRNDEIVFQKDIVFANTLSYYNLPLELTLDIAFPDALADGVNKRPLVVLIHGGGFCCGDKWAYDTFCIQLAQRGYVAATINYRQGNDFGSGACSNSPSKLSKIIYSDMQDGHAALRYLTENANVYGIDTSLIFIGGQSSGAMIALNMAFAQQQDLDAAFPHLSDTMGLVNASGNSLTDIYSIKGVISMWGAMFDTAMITTERIPVMMMHGTADLLVPYTVGTFYDCPQSSPHRNFYGSRPIADRLRNLGVCYDLDTAANAGHGLYPHDYKLEHVACFLNNIICNTCITSEHDSTPACAPKPTPPAPRLQSTEWKISLFPNPASQTLTFEANTSGPYSIQLYDMIARPLLQYTVGSSGELDISSLSKGIYMVRVTCENQSEVAKILVK